MPVMSPFETQQSPEKLQTRWRCGGRQAEVHAITKKVSDARARRMLTYADVCGRMLTYADMQVSDARASRDLHALHQLYQARARTAAANS